MSLIDAIKSRRPFRRKGTSEKWIVQNDDLLEWDNGERFIGSQVSWLVADDWEILEPMVTITMTQFWEALREFCAEEGIYGPRSVYAGLARKLGLEPE